MVGKTRPSKPVRAKPPRWVRYKPFEVEKIILKLAKAGKSSTEIGLLLRDQYGIPNVKLLVGKSINKILKEAGMRPKLPEDLRNLIQRAVNLRKHLKVHRKDVHSRRGLSLIESKIARLARYYKRKKVLPKDWQYDPEKAELLLR
jgi:small subunit ribosomal protein S15